MAYQVLARKWRPARFDQVIGQEHVLKALTHALEQNRLHHAYLFSGTRGVGKTSIARLLAKGLNCETGITATPCDQCSHCQEINQGRFVDLLEIDAASRTKVDDTREILDNVQYQPVRGRFKVYLIDEVHMLSRHSFNALLKTLEEPPAHVKFLLATTDPQKLPVTVLSRCLQFNLKSVPVSRISHHLTTVLTDEQVSFEAPALELLAQAADGSVRDGMSLTDQAIAHGGGQVLLASVQAMLGTLDSQYALRLLQALAQGDAATLMTVLDEIEPFAPDHDDLLKQMASALHQMALCQFNVRSSGLTEHGQSILTLAQILDREQVQLWYQMLTQGRADLKLAPDPRSGLEMVLLRALAFAPLEPAPPMMAVQPQANAPSFAVSSNAAVTPPVLPHSKLPAPSSTIEPVPANKHEPDSDEEDRALTASLNAEQAALLAQAQIQQADSLTAEPRSFEPEPSVEHPDVDPEPNATEHILADPSLDQVATAATTEELSDRSEPVEPLAEWVSEPLSTEPPLSDEPTQSEAQDPPTVPWQEPPSPTNEPTAGGELSLNSVAEPVAETPPEPTAAGVNPFQSLLEQALANHQNLQSRSEVASNVEPSPEPAPPAKAQVKVQTIELSNPDTPPPDQRPSFGLSNAQFNPFADHAVGSEHSTVNAPTPPQDDDPPPWVLEALPVQDPSYDQFDPLLAEAVNDPQPLDEPSVLTPVFLATEPVEQTNAEPNLSQPESIQPEFTASATALSASHETDLQWYEVMAKLAIGGRPRQLAVNSVLERDQAIVRLHLSADQPHLNNPAVIEPLKAALTEIWGQDIELHVVGSNLEGRETPLMVRRRLHQERLQQARISLLNDPAVQWLQSQFDAKLIEESVGYQ